MMTRRTILELATLSAAAAAMQAAEPPFTLPKLPYAYDALEPYIDAQTMQIHHDKHHQAYVDNLNKAIAGDAALSKLTVDELLERLDTLPAQFAPRCETRAAGTPITLCSGKRSPGIQKRQSRAGSWPPP